VTLGACFNCRGDAPPPLLVPARPQCALEELASLHERSLWLSVNRSGWVDRVIFRQWCQWFASWMAEIMALWRLGPEDPAILVLDNAPTRENLLALRLLAANHIHVVTLPPHLTHIMQPVDVRWARAFKAAYGRWLTKWLRLGALERAHSRLAPAAFRGQTTASGDSRVCISLAASDAAKGVTSTFNASHAFAAAGLVSSNVERPFWRNCETDIEREDEAGTPHRIHTGSPVPGAFGRIRCCSGVAEASWSWSSQAGRWSRITSGARAGASARSDLWMRTLWKWTCWLPLPRPSRSRLRLPTE
jgi:hypothetical protein